jgi:hypothetical protein
MATNVITLEDLEIFKVELKQELISELKTIIGLPENKKVSEIMGTTFLKSYQVKEILKISSGTLQNLRINGTLPFTKIGGTILYSSDDIQRIVDQNKFNCNQ